MTSVKAQTRAQVLLTFPRSDRKFADRVGDLLRAAGLEVVGMDQLRMAGEYNDSVRDGINRSDALVVALSGVGFSPGLAASVNFEIGAAMGAGKPIYVVVEDATRRLGLTVPHMQVLPISRIDEIVDKLGLRH